MATVALGIQGSLYSRGWQPFSSRGPKQTQHSMVVHTNFPPKIPVPLLFMMLKLGNLWNFNQIC